MKLTQTQTTILITFVTIGVIIYALYKAGVFVPRLSGGAKGDQLKYKNLADDAYNSLAGTNFSSYSFGRIANELLVLDNSELVSVVNAYASKYQSKELNTLRKLINNEYLACGDWYYMGYTSENCEKRDLLNKRFNEIGA